jgi:hypothetical protein
MPAFSYNISLTGDCSNDGSGAILLSLNGGTPPFTVEFLSPITNTYTNVTEPLLVTGLFADNYNLRVNDSTLPVNLEYYINIPISNGVCAGLVELEPTSCNSDNGSVIISATTLYSSTNYSLFDNEDNFIASGLSSLSQYEFTSLEPGVYYSVVTDLGGCTGRTSDFIIENSSSLDYGLYVVPTTSCDGIPNGKIFVTGQTGVSPFTYLWSNGQTTSSITGLTEGSYSVQVTDSDNCSVTKSAIISQVPVLGVGLVTVIQPQPFTNNGSITVNVTGGTSPYYYSATTGDYDISYLSYWTLSGLSAGDYGFSITDTSLCNTQTNVSLLASDGFSAVDVTVTNSNCSNSDASISISVIGGDAPYTFRLIYPDGNIVSITNNLRYYTFTNLDAGEYTVSVQDSNGSFYSEDVIVVVQTKFDYTLLITGTSCNDNNGSVNINVFPTDNNCVCCANDLYVYNEDLLSASGNTESQYDNKVWAEYVGCDGETKEVSFAAEGVYDFCASGSCHSATIEECFDLNLCCQWNIFYEGEDILEYTFEDCSGMMTTIQVNGGQYSEAFCAKNPPQGLLYTLLHLGSCTDCDCYDGETIGEYEYYDCNNVLQQGSSSGDNVCFNNNLPYNGISPISESVSCSCSTPYIYVWRDNVKRPLVRGYFLSTNENCCTENILSFPLNYSLDGGSQVINNSFLSNITFTNLSSGQHTITVTDSTGCARTKNFVVDSSESLDFTLFATSCGSGDEGTISVIINSGQPPFTFQWSENVSGNPQTYLVENLSADTYTLSVTDANGCCVVRQITIECQQTYNPYLYYVMGEDVFELTQIGKCSLLKLYNEGYQEIRDVYPDCVMEYSEFIAKVTVTPSGYTAEQYFYTSNSLTDVPDDQLWIDTLVSLISNIPGVLSVEVNVPNNTILVNTIPGSTNLNGQKIKVELVINYVLDCGTT